MQELAWLIKNEVDLEKAQSNQFFRVPFIELGPLIPPIAFEKVKHPCFIGNSRHKNFHPTIKLGYTELYGTTDICSF